MSLAVRPPMERILAAQDTLHALNDHVQDGLALAQGPDGYVARAHATSVLPGTAGIRELDARVWVEIFDILDQQGLDDHRARLALLLQASYDLTLVR